MKRIAFIVVIFPLAFGCATTRTNQESAITAINESAAKAINHCENKQDLILRVFHVMYKDKKSAENAYAQILANTTESQFSQLKAMAKRRTIDEASREKGGDLGYIRYGEFDRAFESAIFNLPFKTLSPPIQTRWGWHLAWIDEAANAKTGARCS